jgi:3-dehydroquinate dehydratase type I
MICVPIKTKALQSLLGHINKANELADVIEIWFDELKLDEDKAGKILKSAKKPLLYKYMGNQSNLKILLSHKIKYIDLDLSESAKLIKDIKKHSPQTQIILSHHDFEVTPSKAEMRKIVRKMKNKGADIVKLATTAKSFQDALNMLSLLEEITQKGIKAICLCMGRQGVLTRATGHLFGNYLMYAPINTSNKTASGQITAEKLKEIRNLI